LTTETSLWTWVSAVCYLDCNEAGLCYLMIHIENLLRPLQLFHFHLWPIYWLSLVITIIWTKFEALTSVAMKMQSSWLIYLVHPRTTPLFWRDKPPPSCRLFLLASCLIYCSVLKTEAMFSSEKKISPWTKWIYSYKEKGCNLSSAFNFQHSKQTLHTRDLVQHTESSSARFTCDALRAGRPRGRSSSPGRMNNFLFSTSSGPALVSTKPAIQWVPGALSLGVKRPGREADHSPSSSAEVSKMWLCTSTSPHAFMA
jgi:hypothetical protein